MIILRPLLLLTNLHLKLLSTQGTGADKLLSTQRVKLRFYARLLLRLAPTWQYFGTITCDGLHGIMKLYIDKP